MSLEPEVWSPYSRIRYLILLHVGTKFDITPNLVGRCQFLLLFYTTFLWNYKRPP